MIYCKFLYETGPFSLCFELLSVPGKIIGWCCKLIIGLHIWFRMSATIHATYLSWKVLLMSNVFNLHLMLTDLGLEEIILMYHAMNLTFELLHGRLPVYRENFAPVLFSPFPPSDLRANLKQR